MKWKLLLFCSALLIFLVAGCSASHYAGSFEAHLSVDQTTGKISGLDVSTTKNYGKIQAEGTIDPKTNMPVFKIYAEKVDATSLAAIVAKSNADIAKSVAKATASGAAGVAGTLAGVPVQ